ncbi:LCP family protein [Nocardioides jejuensis]|uniref:LytR family transcriptional regulator n=1 Tax=Nocardioides jejuensis TaxID=2502782 RepID=A0A4R1BXS7_9ACTN|nr:LCP family protein [Nocardioides jejuensis]TCJ22447.1 LytR family transcriptional regulator [Nocardioides jejuensis]
MPPVLPPGSHLSREHDRAARIRFRRAITLMAMTIVLPGSAQLVAGNRKVGRIALRIVLCLIALAVLFGLIGLVWHPFLLKLGSSPSFLLLLRLGLIAGAVGWFALLVDAWRLGQPLTLVKNHRLAMTGMNAVLTFCVAGSLLFGAHIVGVSRDALLQLSGHGGNGNANDGRYNVLLLGGDSGASRWGMRPDSLQIASVDAETGRTVLIGLPRNMENFHFAPGSVMDKQFPDGFNCDACYLNGVSTWAGDHTDLFKGSDNPGIDATVMAIEGITGLKINYWAMVNLQGFRDVVNAVGGVKLHVREPIPVGLPGDSFYTHLKTGYYRLNGFEALWYARARHDSDDYSRMARQKCMINALSQQVSPETVVRKFGAIAKATSGMIETNIPTGDFSTLVPLAMKARSQKISTLSLVPPLVRDTAHPDMGFIHDKVKQAIDKAEGKAGKPAGKAVVPSASSAPNGETQRGGSIGTRETGYAANDSTDLSSAC